MAGFNNDPISRIVQPNLTTVIFAAYQVGEIAATMLIHPLTGKSSAGNTMLLFCDLNVAYVHHL